MSNTDPILAYIDYSIYKRKLILYRKKPIALGGEKFYKPP